MEAIKSRMGSGSVMADSLATSASRDEPGLAAIRPGRFYASDETIRSCAGILRIASAGRSAVAAGRLARSVHTPDLVQRLAPADRCHPGARQTNRHRGAADSRAGAGDDFPIYHGVLNRAVWSSRAVAGWLLRLLVAGFLGAD